MFAATTSILPLLRATSQRPLLTRRTPTTVRTFTSTQLRSLAAPQSTQEEELNQAQRYLANKAARKAARASNPTGASARHASLYSHIFPALLRILAYGSSAYFGLHLLWNVLDRDEQTKLMKAHTAGLESTARSIAEKVEQAQAKVSDAGSKVVSEVKDGQKEGKKSWWPF